MLTARIGGETLAKLLPVAPLPPSTSYPSYAWWKGSSSYRDYGIAEVTCITHTHSLSLSLSLFLKEHFLAKSIFGCLLSILRYLTILSQSNLLFRWKSEALHVAGFPAPETPGLLPGDSGVQRPETLGQGPETPAQVSGASFRRVSLAPDMGEETLAGARLWPETPVLGYLARRLRSLDPGDSGLKRQQRLVHLLGLYKGFFHLKSRLRLTLSHLHCCQASKL
jgi:hypothetical protein